MSNTEQASEPTMEEILSSIRKIISDDDQSAAEPVGSVEAAPVEPEPVEEEVAEQVEPEPEVPEPVEAAATEPPEAAFDEAEDDPNDDIFELTDVVEEEPLADVPDAEPMELIDPDTIDDLEFASESVEPEPEIAVAPEPPVLELADPEPPLAVEPAIAPAMAGPQDGLLSDEAGVSASAAFGKLAETMLLNNGDAKTIEELVQEMLRPMLKMWLDDNLPSLVERLVREEIERVARRR